MSLPRTYSPAEAAALLGTHREVVYKWIRTGQIPDRLIARVGAKVYIFADDFDAWFTAGANRQQRGA